MTELKITPEAVKNAAAKCKQAESVLKELFPEVFEEDKSVDCTTNNLSYEATEHIQSLAEKGKPSYVISVGFASAPNHLKNKCFALGKYYNWNIIEHEGIKLLIPTRK